jgi:hypothetical protein
MRNRFLRASSLARLRGAMCSVRPIAEAFGTPQLSKPVRRCLRDERHSRKHFIALDIVQAIIAYTPMSAPA